MPYRLLLAVVLTLLVWGPARGASHFTAALAVEEEYNSNVNEEPQGKEDFITRVSTRVGMALERPRLVLESDYSGAFLHYAKDRREEEFIHDLEAHGLLEIMKGLLFFDALDSVGQVNREPSQGIPLAYDTSSQGRVTRNHLALSPYATLPLWRRGVLRTGYEYSEISYPEELDKSNEDADLEGRREHKGFGNLDYALTVNLSALAGYAHTWSETRDRDYTRQVAHAGFGYDYSDDSRIRATAGGSRTTYSDTDEEFDSAYWSLDLKHTFAALTARLESSVDYIDDPESDTPLLNRWVSLNLTRSFARSSLTAFGRYEEYETDFSDKVTTLSVAGLEAEHSLTQRWTITADGSWDLRQEPQADTVRWFAGGGLGYQIGEHLAARLWYRFKVSSSDRAEEEFEVERTGLELSASF